VLRRIFGQKRDEITGWRELHSEKLCILYPSPNIIRLMKSRTMILAGYLASLEEKICIQNFGRKARRKETTTKT
jgi:hypothetical protein